jgi:hypothetical protein
VSPIITFTTNTTSFSAFTNTYFVIVVIVITITIIEYISLDFTHLCSAVVTIVDVIITSLPPRGLIVTVGRRDFLDITAG